MSLWELINPSDPYTFESPSHEVAALVVIALGSGKCGGREILDDGVEGLEVPIMFFGGVEWYDKTFGRDIAAGVDALRPQVADALDSLLIGSAGERLRMERVFEAITSPEDRAAARLAWHDEKRSSLNDYGPWAASLAKNLRAQAEARGSGG